MAIKFLLEHVRYIPVSDGQDVAMLMNFFTQTVILYGLKLTHDFIFIFY